MSWSPVSAGEPRYPSGPKGKGGKQGREAKGMRKIPQGVAEAVQAEALQGRKQADIAERYGVSRWYVARLMKTVTETNPDEVATLRKRLPERLTMLASAFTEEAMVSLEDGRMSDATKATFGAKLAIEGNRWAQPGADNPGATILNFIEALNKAGGGSLTVGPQPALPAPIEAIAEHAE